VLLGDAGTRDGVGTLVGITEGKFVDVVGPAVGESDGDPEGNAVGDDVGLEVGSIVLSLAWRKRLESWAGKSTNV